VSPLRGLDIPLYMMSYKGGASMELTSKWHILKSDLSRNSILNPQPFIEAPFSIQWQRRIFEA
jgi:hypothetical protein